MLDWQTIANNVISGLIIAAITGACALLWTQFIGKPKDRHDGAALTSAARGGLAKGTGGMLKGYQIRRREPLRIAAKSMGLITAESLAIATGVGYAVAFVYQVGFVSYYGIPAETIRVSPEWVIFVAILFVPFALAFLSGATLGRQLSLSVLRVRGWKFRLGLIGLGAVFIITHIYLPAGLLTQRLSIAGMVLVAFAMLDALFQRVPRTSVMHGLLRGVSIIAVAFVVGVVVVTTAQVTGYRSASLQDTYLVDVQNHRALVYSTDTLYVFAGYDRATASLESTLTYVSSSDFGTGGMTLVNTKTGSLKSAVAGQ